MRDQTVSKSENFSLCENDHLDNLTLHVLALLFLQFLHVSLLILFFGSS